MRTQRTSTLQRQTDAFRAKVLAMESESTRLLSQTYADALTVLEPRILALSKQIEEARANGQEPGISWLFQQERYQELRRQLLTLMDQYGEATKLITTEAQKVIVREALQHAGNTLLSVSGGSGDEIATLARGWASVPDESIINLVGAMQSGTPLDATIQSYGVDAVQDVQQALTRGLALGDSAQMTTQVIRALGVTRARAESLVRTETLRAARTATIAAYQQSGVVRAWRWSSAHDARCCPACLALDGRVFKLTEPHKFHVNCFPAGTLCSGPKPIASASRWYEGDLVDIRFASGDHLSVTPNHPILTPHGWVAAGLLNEDSSVIRSSLPKREVSAIYPHYQDGPALIEQIAESLGGEGLVVSVRMPVAAEDFHGDGRGSKVSVIRTDRELGSRFDTPIGQPALHRLLVWRDMILSELVRFRSATSLIPRLDAIRRSLMSFCGQGLSLLGAGLSHSGIHAFGSTTGSYTGGYQPISDTGSCHAITGGERFLGFASKVSSHHFLNRESVPISPDNFDLANSHGFALFEGAKNPTLSEDGSERAFEHMESLGSILGTFASYVSLDRILNVSVRRFSGHVYNLETTDGWYIANNIITHNCRCSASPVLNDWPDKPDYQTGSEWLAQQPLSVQEQVLGRTAAADYRAGNLQLGDFVKLTHSDDWGDSYVNGGLTHARKQATKAGRAPSEWATAPPITRTRKVTPKQAPKQATQPASRQAPARGRDLTGEAFVEFMLDV